MSNKVNKEDVVVTPKVPKAGYESLIAPTGMANDAMSGWRSQLGNMNKQYGGDILGYGTSEAFKGLDSKAQSQYYTDLNNYNALYGTVSGYDADYMQQAKNAKRAEEYANTRRALMERYLPETLAAMGYAGSGAASDAVLKLNNAYDNYAINAQTTAAQNQADIMSKYRQSALDWDSQRNAKNQETLNTQMAQFDAYREAMYDEGTAFDWKQVETDLKLGKITETQYNDLKKEYDSIVYPSKNLSEGEVAKYNIDTNASGAKAIDPKTLDSKTAESYLGKDVYGGDKQSKWVEKLLVESKNWGKEKNGTFADFNYGMVSGRREKGTIYVFYNGVWYPTNYSRSSAIKALGNKLMLDGKSLIEVMQTS